MVSSCSRWVRASRSSVRTCTSFSPAWADWILNRCAPRVAERGWQGFFLDTLDSARLPEGLPESAYALREKALAAAEKSGTALRRGVYIGVNGPQFETPAEIRAFRTLGADAVGMSTVFEVIAASHCGLPVLGLDDLGVAQEQREVGA